MINKIIEAFRLVNSDIVTYKVQVVAVIELVVNLFAMATIVVGATFLGGKFALETSDSLLYFWITLCLSAGIGMGIYIYLASVYFKLKGLLK